VRPTRTTAAKRSAARHVRDLVRRHNGNTHAFQPRRGDVRGDRPAGAITRTRTTPGQPGFSNGPRSTELRRGGLAHYRRLSGRISLASGGYRGAMADGDDHALSALDGTPATGRGGCDRRSGRWDYHADAHSVTAGGSPTPFYRLATASAASPPGTCCFTKGSSWVGGHRGTEVMAGIAPKRCELLALLGGLDTFGEDRHAQRVGAPPRPRSG
jgi:hypothetical protein